MKRAMKWARVAGAVTILTTVGEAIALLVRGVGLNWFNGATLLLTLVAGVLAYRATHLRSIVVADVILIIALAPTVEWPFFAPAIVLLLVATLLFRSATAQSRANALATGV
jgi:hypothetical protein